MFFCVGGFPLTYNIIWFYVVQIMYCTLRKKNFVYSVESGTSEKVYSGAQVSRLCYFLWLCLKQWEKDKVQKIMQKIRKACLIHQKLCLLNSNFKLGEISEEYCRHPLSRTPTGPGKKFEGANAWDSGKFKIPAFYKTLGKSNIVFTSVLILGKS